MRIATWMLAALTAAGVVARLLPVSISDLPFLPVITAVTPLYAATAVLALALTLAPRAWRHRHAGRRIVRIVAVIALALEAAWTAPLAMPSPRVEGIQAAGDTVSLRVMTCNVYKGAASAEDIVEAVRDQHVQVLTLQETTVEFVEQLEAAGIDEPLPYSERSSSDGVYGNGVWSAFPLADVASDDIGSSASAMPAGTIEVTRPSGATARLRVVSVHTCSPQPGYWRLWRRSIEEIGVVRTRLAADPGTSYVLMGDFNATYDHAPFREMLGEGETGGTTLHDAVREAGQGIVATWPAGAAVPPLCGIDHVVTSEDVAATDLETLAIPGSDHAALLATLTV